LNGAKLYDVKVQEEKSRKEREKRLALRNVSLKSAHNHVLASWASKG
jgi:hypothetical protein